MREDLLTYQIEDYGRKSAFASFLPGISGVRGIPVWCYYVNRGQGVVSFGIENKDHAIMEFYPAHQAYQTVKTTGFRTFVKKDGAVLEPFHDEGIPHSMSISMNGLAIEERNEAEGLLTRVCYFTLPGEPIGALVRKVSVRNIGKKAVRLEILDGMPACIPYGIGHEGIKTMGQTLRAWMQVDRAGDIPYMKARASTADSAAVTEIRGGNFSIGSLADGTRLKTITDPAVIFSYDLSLQNPVAFRSHSIRELEQAAEINENLVPCCFYGMEADLQAGEETVLYELTGQVGQKELLLQFAGNRLDAVYYDKKQQEADNLAVQLCRHIRTRTADKNFDAYCQYTYLDNVLRGGYPIRLAADKMFYVYSRKHGDLERDYNYFSMLPEFYSQGNGNFRDVNQNRRCDAFFTPAVGDENIRTFYSLIQPDGYNPLGVEKVTYRLDAQDVNEIFQDSPVEMRKYFGGMLTEPFTPGALYRELERLEDTQEKREAVFHRAMELAQGVVNGKFIEGYWSDHWTYNLDLLESYLAVFPEKEEELLYTKKYTCYRPQAAVRKRAQRCVRTMNGIRQYRALDRLDVPDGSLLRSDCGDGKVICVTLMEKLLLLSVTKFTTLDAYGMGVEMEGGKPGWYDALNGLPGLFGSSILLVVLAGICLLPFALMIVNSTRSGNEIMTSFSLLPGSSLVSNWKIVTDNLNIARGFGNSLFVAICSTLLTAYFSALTAYGFAFFKFRGNKIIFTAILIFMMIPSQLGMLGFYDLMTKMGLIDSYIPLIVPSIASPATVFFLRQYVVSVMPKSLLEAPRIDGASEFYIFHKIVIPLMAPGIATMSIGAFIGSWNNYLMPLILLNSSEKWTLPVMVASLNSVKDIASNVGATYVTVAISVVPIMIMFCFCSRYIISGISAGSVKE